MELLSITIVALIFCLGYRFGQLDERRQVQPRLVRKPNGGKKPVRSKSDYWPDKLDE